MCRGNSNSVPLRPRGIIERTRAHLQCFGTAWHVEMQYVGANSVYSGSTITTLETKGQFQILQSTESADVLLSPSEHLIDTVCIENLS